MWWEFKSGVYDEHQEATGNTTLSFTFNTMDTVQSAIQTAREQLEQVPTSALVSAGALYAAFLVYYLGETRKLKHIPAVGQESAILSYVDLIKFMANSPKFLANAFAKTQMVKIPGLFEWTVLVSGKDLIEEVRKAPEEKLSFEKATEETLQTHLTMGPPIAENPYHVAVVRNQLKRATPQLVPDVYDELVHAFQEYLQPPADGGWQSFHMQPILMKVICRASNRTFVGLPLCRDPDYIELNVKYTVEVVTTGAVLRALPTFIRPFVASLLPTVKNRIDQATKHISPLIRHRREQIELLGDEFERPLDFLMWLIEDAKGEETTEKALSNRILVLNFAAIHTSTMTFTQALYDLAAHPEYAETLRQEVQSAVSEEGWSKGAVDKMQKLDSFIKESQRLRPMANVLMNRVVMNDYTFGNGVTLPKGSTIAVDLTDMHMSPDYDNAKEFDPWRFYKIQTETGKRSDMTTTTSDFLAFGHGRHACPGRFFAAVEIKLMMAYLVLNYDVKCEQDGVRPKDMWVGQTCVPDPKANLLFRKRQ
ncbi:cytochrome P450 [Coprinopsis sp. MPI-PUGE-AT-0042]|nr:cytochrome P450 [Coprinopsis sp. MPI-PUGE-AT-0042]